LAPITLGFLESCPDFIDLYVESVLLGGFYRYNNDRDDSQPDIGLMRRYNIRQGGYEKKIKAG